MGVEQEEKMIHDGESEKRGFSVTFTNGTLEQLEELKTFFGKEDKLEVIKLGISILQQAKESREKIEAEKK